MSEEAMSREELAVFKAWGALSFFALAFLLASMTAAKLSQLPPVPPTPIAPTPTGPLHGATEALDEVNAARKAYGLPPFARDDGLTEAAAAAAVYRAAHLMAGHTGNDFAYLPTGAKADAAGCAAWTPDWGWGACCTYERWQYAGAAWAPGKDGRRYMHLFVRGKP